MRQYRARIGHPKNDATWDRIMGIVSNIVLIPKADLLDMAYEVYEGVFDCCFSYEIIDIENEVHATIFTNLIEEPMIHFNEVWQQPPTPNVLVARHGCLCLGCCL